MKDGPFAAVDTFRELFVFHPGPHPSLSGSPSVALAADAPSLWCTAEERLEGLRIALPGLKHLLLGRTDGRTETARSADRSADGLVHADGAWEGTHT